MSAYRINRPETTSSLSVRPDNSPSATMKRLYDQGFWPIAVYPKGARVPSRSNLAEGKEPIGSKWGLERWTPQRWDAEDARIGGVGVGVCLGPGRGPGGTWLVDIEGDGPEAEESRAKLFGDIDIVTLGWNSVRGRHQLLIADLARLAEIMPGLKDLESKGATSTGVYKSDTLPGLEMRIGGYKVNGGNQIVKQIQSVVPPTPGTDGRPRVWNGCNSVGDAPETFYAVLAALVVKPNKTTPPPVPQKRCGSGATSKERYVLAALEKEIGVLLNASPGNRNNQLNVSAFKLGQLVGAGALSRSTVEAHLRDAVEQMGKVGGESEATIRSGLESGINSPRILPDERSRVSAKRPPLRLVVADEEPPAATSIPTRPSIEVNTERHEVETKALDALRADPDLYYRGESLVTVIRESSNLVHLTSQTTMVNVAGSPKIITLADPVIGTRITSFAEFFKWRTGRDGEMTMVSAHPPDWLIKSIATRKYWPNIRPLVAVAECPYPRPDGTLVETPGYDESTAILYAPSVVFPEVPTKPTRGDAEASWHRIRQIVRHFPFRSPDDEVVYLAGVLGVIARQGIIGSMPGIAVNGNKAGTGKGYLVNGMVIPGTGRIAPCSKYPYDDAEAGKVKTSIVRSGKSVVSFDNLNEGTKYGGGDVDSLITAKVTDDRVLGASEQTGELIVRLVCFCNGNNIEPVKDAHRRWLVCNLETSFEHPERRSDLLDEHGKPLPDFDAQVLDARPEIVRDALTILRSHAQAGWPNGGWAPLGSFGHWDRVVRGAVWFATGRDCTTTQQIAAEESSERIEKLALLEGIRELPGGKFGERGVTCAEAVRFVEGFPDQYHTMRNALLSRGRNGKLADSTQLGNILRGLANNPIGGYKLVKHPILKQKVVAWVVDEIAPDQ